MRTRNSTLFDVAPVTLLMLGINILFYAISAKYSDNLLDINRTVLLNMHGSMRELVWEGEWIRLIAPCFLHGGLMHILLNSMALYNLGPGTEVQFGSANFGTIYLVSGICGFCCSQIFGGHLSIGASCSLFGIIGADLAVKIMACPVLKNAWRNSDVRRTVYFALFYLAIGWIGMLGNVDNWGHFGGLLSGMLLGSLFEVWRVRQRIGVFRIASVVFLLTLLVCAARWSIFSPYYHVHMMALAVEEEHRPDKAAQEFEQARRWAKFWNVEPRINSLIYEYQRGTWSLNDVRVYGYSGLR